MISSSANSTAATGVLKAADERAGGADRDSSRTRCGEQAAATGQ